MKGCIGGVKGMGYFRLSMHTVVLMCIAMVGVSSAYFDQSLFTLISQHLSEGYAKALAFFPACTFIYFFIMQDKRWFELNLGSSLHKGLIISLFLLGLGMLALNWLQLTPAQWIIQQQALSEVSYWVYTVLGLTGLLAYGVLLSYTLSTMVNWFSYQSLEIMGPKLSSGLLVVLTLCPFLFIMSKIPSFVQANVAHGVIYAVASGLMLTYECCYKKQS